MAFMDISLCCVVSGCVGTGGTWSLGNDLVGLAVLVLIVFECCVVVYLASSGEDETRYGVLCGCVVGTWPVQAMMEPGTVRFVLCGCVVGAWPVQERMKPGTLQCVVC